MSSYNEWIVIYLLGLAEILEKDLETEILNKVEKNENRVYKNVDGVNPLIHVFCSLVYVSLQN